MKNPVSFFTYFIIFLPKASKNQLNSAYRSGWYRCESSDTWVLGLRKSTSQRSWETLTERDSPFPSPHSKSNLTPIPWILLLIYISYPPISHSLSYYNGVLVRPFFIFSIFSIQPSHISPMDLSKACIWSYHLLVIFPQVRIKYNSLPLP